MKFGPDVTVVYLPSAYISLTMHFGFTSVEQVSPSPHGASGAVQHASPGAPQGGGAASTAASEPASFGVASGGAPVSMALASLPPSSCGAMVVSPTHATR